MAIYISVVSHAHGSIIKEIDCIKELAAEFHLVIKNNTQDPVLTDYCHNTKIHIVDKEYGCGFGANNNIAFSYCVNQLGMKAEDHFIVLNPDIDISVSTIRNLVDKMRETDTYLASINLYKDREHTVYDNSVRHFPTLATFFKSYLGMGNETIIDKNTIKDECNVDWAAGSFLAFQSGHYLELKGFDDGYFMYCEDIDICFRSASRRKPLVYFPNFKAVHLAKHANRKLFSKHFYWHVKSVIRFMLAKNKLVKPTSSIP